MANGQGFMGVEYECKCSGNQGIFLVVEQAKSVLLENKGAEKIVKTLGVLEKSFDEKSDNRVELAACGSMLNVASDDGMEKKTSLFTNSLFCRYFWEVWKDGELYPMNKKGWPTIQA